jgi:hypothetical protein
MRLAARLPPLLAREGPPLVALLLGLLAQVTLAGGWSSLGRWLWIDEFFTLALAADASLAQMLAHLGRGADCSPPGMYLLLRGYLFFWPTASEVALRSFSLLSGAAAAAGLYALLRHVCLPRIAVAATLATFAHPVVAEQMYNARAYLPWMAAAAWCALFVVRARQRPNAATATGLAISSMVLCTIHYYGVITLLLIAGCDWLFNLRRSPRDTARTVQTEGPTVDRPQADFILRPPATIVLALVAGPVALAASSPLYFGQRDALTIATWVEPLHAGRLSLFIGAMVPSAAIASAALFWWTALCLTRRSRNQAGPALLPVGWQSTARSARPTTCAGGARILPARLRSSIADISPLHDEVSDSDAARSMAALWGLTLLIPVLVLFSLLVQPTLVPRYGIVAALGFAPLTAALLARCGPWLTLAACLWYALLGSMEHQACVETARAEQTMMQDLVASLRGCPKDLPIVFESPHDLFPVCRYAPDLAPRASYLDFEPAELSQAHANRTFGRDITRVYARLYGGVRFTNLAELRSQPRWLLVHSRFPYEIDPRGYPPFEERLLAPRLYELR